jgi:hypothetical protein
MSLQAAGARVRISTSLYAVTGLGQAEELVGWLGVDFADPSRAESYLRTVAFSSKLRCSYDQVMLFILLIFDVTLHKHTF